MADIVYSGQQAGGPLNRGSLPANYDLVIYKGDFVRLLLTMTDADDAPLNLTGATPKAVLKTDYSDPAPIPFTCTLKNAVAGEVELFISSQTSSTIIPGSYIWDFQITFADNQTRTYLAGDVTVFNEVTT